jgi:hypothetical protein
MAKYKTIIGRAESIDFPVWLLVDVPAKVDTGAYLSAVHATNIKETTKKGKKVLKFTLLGDHPSYPYSREIEVSQYELKTVENSFGVKQERYSIKLKAKLAGKVFISEFTLADRSTKVFPILLGRTFLNNRFMVDTNIANIDRRILKEKLKDWLAKDDKSDDEENIL